MRKTDVFTVGWALLLASGFAGAGPAAAQDGQRLLIPERRIQIEGDRDFPGGDLQQIFDITAERCIEICLGDAACTAFTYNTQSRACFPKSGMVSAEVYTGAVSGFVVPQGDAAILAAQRAGAAAFLSADDLEAALQQARAAALRWGPLAPQEAGTDKTQAALDIAAAGALVAQSDHADDWLSLAGLLRQQGYYNTQAASAAINAYLRAGQDASAAAALLEIGRIWDDGGNGRKALSAARLAAELDNSPDVRAARDRLEARWGMRITGHDVKSDNMPPQLCLNFSGNLSDTIDYMPYLRLPEGDLTVEASHQDLCISGFVHGSNVEVTARAGLPDASGEVLDRDVAITAYIGNRSPSLRFAGRAYVLPASGDRGLEVVTVNVGQLDLQLLHVSDRNLVASMRADLFARPLDSWAADWLADGMATHIWSGSAEVAGTDGDPDAFLNKEVTTRLAIPDAAGPLAPGAYVLKAALPDAEGADYNPYNQVATVAAQWFVVSDLGLSSLWGEDRLTVVVRGLSDAGPRPHVRVALVSRANEVLAEVEADADGVAHFDASLARGRDGAAPAMVTATQYDGASGGIRDMSFLSLTEAEFDLSDRGVAGLPPSAAVDVFMATDRGVYRAGETVNVTALARDGTARAVEKLPLTAVLTRPDGVEAARLRLQPDSAGGYVYELPLAASAPSGTWRLEMRAGDKGEAMASTRILVEDFLPERIDFATAIPEGPLAAGAALPVSLTARWLYDAPASGLPVEIWLRTAPAHALPAFPGYRFGLVDDSGAEQQNIGSGVTDDLGGFTTSASLLQPDRMVEADFTIEVSEGAGRPVKRQERRIVMPDTVSLGIRPVFEGDTVSEGDKAGFNLIALDSRQQVVPTPARWILTRLEHEYIWYRAGNRWNWEVVTKRSRVDSGEVDIAEGSVLALPVKWGEYELRVETTEGHGAASTVFRAGWAMAAAGSESPDRLDVRLDKSAYRSGDTAELSIEAASGGIGIITVLTNRIVDLRLVDLKAGSNLVGMPVTDEWGAGAYVTASLIRPLDVGGADAQEPVRSLGLAYAPVDPAQRRLAVALDVPSAPAPRESFPVRIKLDGAAGGTAFASIAVVDQGILNITGHEAPDPEAHYFGQRRLGVALRDLYGRLLLATGAADGKLREGGDAQAGLQPAAPPPTEVLMAYFSGPVRLDDRGEAVVDVAVPDFNGTVRIMAMAWTSGAIGQAQQEVVIRDPVVATVTAPRFLSMGDQAALQVDLAHADGPVGEVSLNIDAVPPILAGDAVSLPETVLLAQKASARISLPLEVPSGGTEGLARLHLAITTPDDRLLGKDVVIPIKDPVREATLRKRLVIPAGEEVVLNGDLLEGLRDVSQISLAAGPLAMLDIPAVLAGLDHAGYGTSQEVVADAAARLYLPQLVSVTGGGRDKASQDPTPGQAVAQAVGRILTRQNSSGAFGTWSADGRTDLWQDAFVTDFLSRVRAAGYEVPEQAWQNALSNLRNALGYATNPAAADAWENAATAYAAFVLARERAISVADLRYYTDAGRDGFKTPLSAAHLAGALAFAGDDRRASVMLAQAMQLLQADSDDPRRRDYGSFLREYAGVHAVALEAGMHPEGLDDGIARIAGLLDQRLYGTTMRLSSTEAFWLVLLAKGLIDTPPALAVNGEALKQVVMPLAGLDGLRLTSGEGAVMVTLTATGRPVTPPEAGGDGYRITRHYEDESGAGVDPASVEAGSLLRAVLTVRPTLQADTGAALVIRDNLPAGFEIERLASGAGESGAGATIPPTVTPDTESMLHDAYLASLVTTDNRAFRVAYMVRAVHAGRFVHPAAEVADLDRPQLGGWTGTTSVEVVPAQ